MSHRTFIESGKPRVQSSEMGCVDTKKNVVNTMVFITENKGTKTMITAPIETIYSTIFH